MTPEYIMPDPGTGEGPIMPGDPTNPEQAAGTTGSEAEDTSVDRGTDEVATDPSGDDQPGGREIQQPERPDSGETDPDDVEIEPDDPQRQMTDEEKEKEISGLLREHLADKGGSAFGESMGALLNKESSKEDILRVGLNLGISSDELLSILKLSGHKEEGETIKYIQSHRHGLDQESAKRKGEGVEEMTDDEKTSLDEVQADMAELQSGLSKASSKISKKEARELNEKANGMLGKLSDKLFAPGTGLLAEGNRAKTAAKVFFTAVITMAMLYAMLLHVATKWATKRVGSG